jgi:hypothetical protein
MRNVLARNVEFQPSQTADTIMKRTASLFSILLKASCSPSTESAVGLFFDEVNAQRMYNRPLLMMIMPNAPQTAGAMMLDILRLYLSMQ